MIDQFDSHDPIYRRMALTGSLSWWVFCGAAALSLLGLIYGVLTTEGLRNWRLVGFVIGPPIVLALLAISYLLHAGQPAKSWAEILLLGVLRIGLWVGTPWQLTCLFYLVLVWGSGRDLTIWFPR